MNYDAALEQAIQRLHDEGRYRTFIDIERRKGAYPQAVWTRPDGSETERMPLSTSSKQPTSSVGP